MPTKHGEKVDKFYHSTRWRNARESFIQMKKGICEVCGKKGNYVHHKTPIDDVNIDDEEITLNFDNFQLLCHDCHEKVHSSIDLGRPTIVLFDENGDVIVKDKC